MKNTHIFLLILSVSLLSFKLVFNKSKIDWHSNVENLNTKPYLAFHEVEKSPNQNQNSALIDTHHQVTSSSQGVVIHLGAEVLYKFDNKNTDPESTTTFKFTGYDNINDKFLVKVEEKMGLEYYLYLANNKTRDTIQFLNIPYFSPDRSIIIDFFSNPIDETVYFKLYKKDSHLLNVSFDQWMFDKNTTPIWYSDSTIGIGYFETSEYWNNRFNASEKYVELTIQ